MSSVAGFQTAPSVNFTGTEIMLARGGKFALGITPGAGDVGASLVIDVYDLNNPVHPEGHLGWWKFPMDALGDKATGHILVKRGRFTLQLSDVSPVQFWLNDAKISFERLVVNAVLRDDITNAIICLDKVPAFKNAKDLSTFRAGFNRNWDQPRYASPGYVFPKGATVHIASRNIHSGDAVGNLCLDIFRMLRQNNIAVEMYAENYDFVINDFVRRIDSLGNLINPDDQLLYFYSTYDPYLESLLSLQCRRRIAYFHGITRPELLQVFDPELSVTCRKGFSQLSTLRKFDVLAANSLASTRKLLARFSSDSRWDEGNINVIPPRLLGGRAIKRTRPATPKQPAKLLYVGRIKSHKKIEHLLELFSAYLELEPGAELWIVGGGADKAYWDYLKWVETDHLEIPEHKVQWIGGISDTELADRYASASAYVSMSEDEGFCLPVLEAMLAGLPVFAYGLPAVREVMDNSGVYFSQKEFGHLAASIHGLLGDPIRVENMIEKQMDRALVLAADMDGSRFLELLQPEYPTSVTRISDMGK